MCWSFYKSWVQISFEDIHRATFPTDNIIEFFGRESSILVVGGARHALEQLKFEELVDERDIDIVYLWESACAISSMHGDQKRVQRQGTACIKQDELDRGE